MGNNHTLCGTDPAIGTSKSERMTIACILLFDEIRDQWELIMFSAANAQRLATQRHDLARSAQSRQ